MDAASLAGRMPYLPPRMHAAAKLVEEYLRILMIPDPEGARRF